MSVPGSGAQGQGWLNGQICRASRLMYGYVVGGTLS